MQRKPPFRFRKRHAAVGHNRTYTAEQPLTTFNRPSVAGHKPPVTNVFPLLRAELPLHALGDDAGIVTTRAVEGNCRQGRAQSDRSGANSPRAAGDKNRSMRMANRFIACASNVSVVVRVHGARTNTLSCHTSPPTACYVFGASVHS